MKKFLATLFIACFAFTFSISSIGCSGEKTSKKDKDDKEHGGDDGGELELNVLETYAILVKILCLKPMLLLVVVLLTGKVGFFEIFLYF